MSRHLYRIAFSAMLSVAPLGGLVYFNRRMCQENIWAIDAQFKEFRRAFWRDSPDIVDEAERWKEREYDKQSRFMNAPLHKQLRWPPEVDFDTSSEEK